MAPRPTARNSATPTGKADLRIKLTRDGLGIKSTNKSALIALAVISVLSIASIALLLIYLGSFSPEVIVGTAVVCCVAIIVVVVVAAIAVVRVSRKRS